MHLNRNIFLIRTEIYDPLIALCCTCALCLSLHSQWLPPALFHWLDSVCKRNTHENGQSEKCCDAQGWEKNIALSVPCSPSALWRQARTKIQSWWRSLEPSSGFMLLDLSISCPVLNCNKPSSPIYFKNLHFIQMATSHDGYVVPRCTPTARGIVPLNTSCWRGEGSGDQISCESSPGPPVTLP